MTPVELIALSLALSIAVAAVCGLAAAGLEQATTDPALRDRAWAWALYLPVLPPLAVAATLLTPAPVRPIPILPTPVLTPEVVDIVPVAVAPATPSVTLDMGQIALAALILTALLVAFRLASLALRGWRLNRLIARTQPASTQIRAIVAERAARLDVASPTVRAGPAVGDALLAGLTRPVLVLPQALAETPDTPAARAVITHELAHLKRGDHRAVWIEEAVIALLAANPILPLIRARRAAAREEACDALALTGAEPAARRAYATSLIEALRARTAPPTLPALTFNGTSRSRAMRRLKSILTPPATAGRGTRLATAVAGASLIAITSLGSVAVASQRQATPQASAAGKEDPNWPSRYLEGTAREGQLFCAAPEGDHDRTFGCDAPLWTVAEQEERLATRAFCTPATTTVPDLEEIAERGRPFVLNATDTSGSALDGARRALIAAYPCQGEAEPATVSDATHYRLSAEWAAQRAARTAAQAAGDAARKASGLRDDTPQAIKASCRTGTACDGFIDGFVIHQNLKPATERAFCAPEDLAAANRWREAKAALARTSPATGEDTATFMTRVLTDAYPCDPSMVATDTALGRGTGSPPTVIQERLLPERTGATSGATRLSMRLEFPQQYRAVPGDRLEVTFRAPAAKSSLTRTVTHILEPGLLPADVFTDLDPSYFARGSSPAIQAAIIAENGVVKARQSDRPKPMFVRGDLGAAVGVITLVGTAALQQVRAREAGTPPRLDTSPLPRITGDQWGSRPQALQPRLSAGSVLRGYSPRQPR